MSRRTRAYLLALALLAVPQVAAAEGVSVHEASKEQWKAAQKTFVAGDELFDAGRFEEALSAYRASHEIVASPNSILQIARSFRETGRTEEAYRAFERAVEIGQAAADRNERYAPTLEVAKKEFEELKAKVGLVRIELKETPRGTELVVGSRTLRPNELSKPLVLAPGEYEVVLSAPQRETRKAKIVVAAGGESALTLDFRVQAAKPQPVQPPPSSQPKARDERTSLRPYAYVAGGVGVAGMAAFTVFGLMTRSKYSDLDEGCPDGHCGPGSQDDIDAGRRYQTFANIGLAVGVVGLGTGIALFALDGSGAEQPNSARVRVGPGSVQIAGRF
ncbi:MAG: tetratricopeptide repeat protein [Polyangiaceae bacterium]